MLYCNVPCLTVLDCMETMLWGLGGRKGEHRNLTLDKLCNKMRILRKPSRVKCFYSRYPVDECLATPNPVCCPGFDSSSLWCSWLLCRPNPLPAPFTRNICRIPNGRYQKPNTESPIRNSPCSISDAHRTWRFLRAQRPAI